jgi:formylmethanofuran dehydrogenase subunit A
MNVHGVNDKAPYFDVTSKEVIVALAEANEMLNLPHSIHIHPNDLGHPGSYIQRIVTTQTWIQNVKGKRKMVVLLTNIDSLSTEYRVDCC